MLPILTTSALVLLSLTPLQGRLNPDTLAQGGAQGRATRPALPQNVAPSNVTRGSLAPRGAKPGAKANVNKNRSLEFVAPGYYGLYSDDKCREIYSACDLNGDDTINYFEARATLDSVSSRKDFRGLDRNNDGVLRLDEFDRYFKQTCESGSNLVVKPKAMGRIHLRSERRRPKDQRILRFFANVDKNGDDKIDAKEWSDISSVLGAGLDSDFLKLDEDFSGDLTVEELEPLKPLFDRFEAAKSAGSHLRPLPEATRSVDLDDDGHLNLPELKRALARIHPSLVQHSKLIFANADLNGDSRLGATEIRKALTLGTKARQVRKLHLR